MIIIGLTGSIGMGKSTIANMLKTLGIPVHDADEEVRSLLSANSPAAVAIRVEFPFYQYPKIYGSKTRTAMRKINRQELGNLVFSDDYERQKLENILHPFVREAQNGFIRAQRSMGKNLVALDIPLLFETGSENMVDYTIVVSAPEFVQAARVLERKNMDEDKFNAILKRQMPDGEKCARADFVVDTGIGRGHSIKQLKTIIREIKTEQKKANG